MELSWCRSFLAVLEHGGFLAAANATHRAQSRVSAHVASLEKAIGERLLNRDVHPPTLTVAGEAFLPHARAAVADWQAGMAAVAWTGGRVRGTVSVGSIPSVNSEILAPAIARIMDDYPGVTFEVHEGPNSWLDDSLAHRVVELMIRPMFEESGLVNVRRELLFEDRFVVVVPRDHRFAGRDSIELGELDGEALISTGEAGFDPHVGVEYRALLADVNIRRERSLAVTQPTTVFAFVRAKIGIGFIGALAARMLSSTDLVVVPIADPDAQRRIGMYWAQTRTLSPAAVEFMSAVREVVRSIADGQRTA